MNTSFKVIGLTRLGIKPKSTAPEADACTTRPAELLNVLISNEMNRYEEVYDKVSSSETRSDESGKNGTVLLNAVADVCATLVDQHHQGMELASLR